MEEGERWSSSTPGDQNEDPDDVETTAPERERERAGSRRLLREMLCFAKRLLAGACGRLGGRREREKWRTFEGRRGMGIHEPV